jgi:hypothetical protein
MTSDLIRSNAVLPTAILRSSIAPMVRSSCSRTFTPRFVSIKDNRFRRAGMDGIAMIARASHSWRHASEFLSEVAILLVSFPNFSILL